MTNVQTQVFNALNGEELIQVIVQRAADALETKLRNSGEFKQHAAFPWVKVSFEAKVLCYPQQNQGDEPNIKVEETIVVGEAIPTEGTPVEIPVTLEKIIDTPDKERVETGLPVPTMATGLGGVKVDKPVLRKGKTR